MNRETLLKRFEGHGLWQAGELLLPPRLALELLDELACLGQAVASVQTWHYNHGQLAETLIMCDCLEETHHNPEQAICRSLAVARKYILYSLPRETVLVSFIFADA